MYATMEETPALAAARALASRASGAEARGLDLLEQQVCAEAGLWAPEAARRALAQARGDVPRAVGLVRVWAAALPRADACVIDEADTILLRRVSAAYAEVAGGQWLGIAPELSSRLLQWDDDAPAGAVEGSPAAPTLPEGSVAVPAPVPVRADCPRIRELLHDVPVLRSDEQGDGDDPAMTALQPPLPRPTRIGVLARGETAGLVSLASLVLGQRREAVLAELTTAIVRVRVPHPRTGVPVVVAEVPVAEAEAVVDADVDDRPGFALGWGVSIGEMDRRAIALALIDGAVQADGATTPLVLDDQTITAAVDGSATNGFVEHLRLPHYASFASYVDQVRRADLATQEDA
ncbi:MAG: carbon-phosphorus lyase complex subunit PhnI [Acidimicrobiales bacterium]|nr:carbon-phosphorus lyase complex subunit PhnI [Acidimicrobiales bacterium]